MCLDHPRKVERAAILDIIPQHYLYNHINKQWATFSWHWFFNIQPFDMPERMMGADPDWFIQKKLAKTKQGLSFFGKEALAEYKRCFRNPETIHAICEDYRAGAGIDLVMDEEDVGGRAQGRLSGAAAMGRDRRGRTQSQSRSEPSIWRSYARNIVGAQALPCGHYLSEEAPKETTAALRAFSRLRLKSPRGVGADRKLCMA